MDRTTAPDVSIQFDEPTSTLSSSSQSPVLERKCPLCKSAIRLFFVNFNDKMVMCENTECEFPFGYEDLQFVKENDEQLCDTELDKRSIKQSYTPAPSTVTKETSFSGIEKINKACMSEDNQSVVSEAVDVNDYINNHQIKKPLISKEEKSIQNDVAAMRKFTQKLESEPEDRTCIRSEEKLLQLAALQKKLGSNLLTPLEMSIVKEAGFFAKKKEECLKIDIKKEGDKLFHIDLEIIDDGEGE